MVKKVKRPLHQPGFFTRSGELTIRSEGEESKRFQLSFSSETPYLRYGEEEILLHTPEAVDLTRLRTAGALLYEHGRDFMGRFPIGRIEEVRLDTENRRCLADITFDEEDESAAAIRRKVEAGMIRGVSVGYRVLEWTALQKNETSADGRFHGPAVLATKWEPYEISIVATPADVTVGVGRSQTIEQEEMAMHEDEKTIDTPETKEAAPTPQERSLEAPAMVPEIQKEVSRALEEQRRTAAAISKRCRMFGIDPSELLEKGLTEAEADREILRRLEEQRPPHTTSVQMVAEEMDKFRAAASDAILMRGGIRQEKPAEGARELRGMRLRDLAIECASRSGKNARRMDDDTLLRTVLSPDSAFVGIVTDSVRKSMAASYAVAETTYQLWTSTGSNPDFKPKQIIQISEAGDLEEVTQNGELTMDHPTDSAVTSVLATFGKTFGFTRQALINDDIDLLSKLPAAYVRAAKRGINRAVYKILRENPVMADGKQLFSAAHSNLGTGATPSVAAYQEAMGRMMHQKNLRGTETLNVRPRFVICDPLQYAEHAKMLRSIADPGAANSGAVNPFQGMMELIMDADLLGESSTGSLPYFFAAGPDSCGTIEVCYLNGVEEPQLDFRMGFDFLGIQYRILHDRGVTLLDHRGLFKNPGGGADKS
jgi:phage head maturation protease